MLFNRMEYNQALKRTDIITLTIAFSDKIKKNENDVDGGS